MANASCVQARSVFAAWQGSLFFARKPNASHSSAHSHLFRKCECPCLPYGKRLLRACTLGLCRMAGLFIFCPKADCSAFLGSLAFAEQMRVSLPAIWQTPLACKHARLLPHGRAFGQKKEVFLVKDLKNYIYQNKRGDNFYKIIIPRSCFKEITKLLNFCEFVPSSAKQKVIRNK